MDDTYAISLATTEYRDGINSGDMDRTMSAIGSSVTLMMDGEPSFWGEEGREVLRCRWQQLLAKNHVKFEVILAILEVFGDQAFAWGWEVLDLAPKSGHK